MNQDQDRYNYNQNKTSVTRALPSILRQVKENSLSILTNQLSEFFNSCDDLFFELANHAGSNNEQNLYFDSMREIRLKKKDVVNCFKDNFNAQFTELVRPNISHIASSGDYNNASFDSLGLIEDDKMEQDVAISSVVSKTRQDCQENLYHLNLRFDYLLPDITVTEANNPLDPKQICEAFTQAAARLELDIKARIILFKQFDRMVARHLNKIYTLANELLVNAGILPKVTPTAVKTASAPTPKTVSTPSENISGDDRPVKEALADAAHPSSMPLYSFDQLSGLLAGLRAAGSAPITPTVSTSGVNFGRAIPREILLDQLNSVQQELAQLDQPQTKEQLQAAIYQILQATGEEGKPSALHQSDEDVINLVSMFFEFILDDRNLPVPIQALISRLQIPVLKIALKDKNFFNNSKHVARVLINEIASVSIGWNESNKEQQDSLFDLINSIVHNINDEFVGECDVFERELERLKAHKSQEAKRAEIVESRTAQAAEGKAKTDHAKEVVQNLLIQRLNNQELPEAVSNFLINYWQKLLVLTRLKSGENSQEWLASLQVVDDLIWVTQNHQDEKSLKRAERIKSSLLPSVAKGLDTISLTEDEQKKQLNILQQVLSGQSDSDSDQALQRTKLKPEQLAALGQTEDGQTKSWKEMSALERQQMKQKALQYEYLKKAQELKVGSWFILQDEKHGKTTRCKLTTIIKPNDRFVFVNRFGQKASEKSKQEVAMDLQKQSLKPLESGPLFDRAMSTIVDNLKKVNNTK